MVVPIYILPKTAQCSLFSTSSPTLVISYIFNNRNSKGCKVIYYRNFHLLSLILSIISHIRWPSVCLLWKNVYSSSLPIFFNHIVCNWIIWVLYFFLTVNPYQTYDLQIFFPIQPVGYFFILLMISFAVINLFSLIWSHLFIFAF